MGRAGYWSILITAAILVGALLALPVWDFYHYKSEDVAKAPMSPPSVAAVGDNTIGEGIAGAPPARSAPPPAPSVAEPGRAASLSQVAPPSIASRNETATAPVRPHTTAPAGPTAIGTSRPPEGVSPARPATASSDRKGPSNGPAAPASAPTRPGQAPLGNAQASIGWLAGSLMPPPPANAPPAAPSPPPAPQPAHTPDASQSSTATAAPADAGDPGPVRLSLAPLRPLTARGETVTVQVMLTGARDITSVPFHLQFDPGVLQYVGGRTGPALDGRSLQPIFLASVNPTRPGDLAVGLSLVRSSGTFNGSGTILLLDFQAVASGRTDLVFDHASVRGPTSAALPAEIVGSTVEVR